MVTNIFNYNNYNNYNMSVTSKLCLLWGFITEKINTYYYYYYQDQECALCISIQFEKNKIVHSIVLCWAKASESVICDKKSVQSEVNYPKWSRVQENTLSFEPSCYKGRKKNQMFVERLNHLIDLNHESWIGSSEKSTRNSKVFSVSECWMKFIDKLKSQVQA